MNCRMEGFCMLKRRLCVLICVMFAVLLGGCTSVKFTMGWANDEFARIEGQTVKMELAAIILADKMKAYETALDGDIWSSAAGGNELLREIKDSVKETIVNLIVMKKIAADYKMTLSSEETEMLKEIAKEYCSETAYYFDTVYDFYCDMYLAHKVFLRATNGIDMEVSEDEARMVSVSYVFISTMKLDENGVAVPLDNRDLAEKKELADYVAALAKDNKDFVALAKEYSDDAQDTLTLGRGMYDIDFENAAFLLESGQVSDVVETSYGLYVIKCSNDNVESDYETRKAAIIEYRRRNAFVDVYQKYAEKLECSYNDDVWDNILIDTNAYGKGNLFDVISTQLK